MSKLRLYRSRGGSPLRSAIAVILTTLMVVPLNAFGQMTDQRPATLRTPQPPSTPLSNDEKVLHILNRFTYGPRPGDLERVRAMGLNAWFQQQLNPQSVKDDALEARLESYPAMQLPLAKLMEIYPTNGMVRAAMNGRAGIPGGEAEKAIYNNQMLRQRDKKNGKDQGQSENFASLSYDRIQGILALPPDKRFSALCKLKPTELRSLRQSLNADQRQHLTDGFTPQQIEELAAFNSPQAVIAAEDMQTKLLRDIYSERQLNEVMTTSG